MHGLRFGSSLVLALLAAPALQAQGSVPIGNLLAEYSWTAFSMQGAGARAMGLGGAFIAVADDASAISFNPSGIAEIVDPEWTFVGRAFSRQQDFRGTDTSRGVGGVEDIFRSATRVSPIFLSGTLPVRAGGRNLSFQFSAHRLFAMGEEIDRKAEGFGTGLQAGRSFALTNHLKQSGSIERYSLAAAYDLSPRMLMGIAYHSWHGNYTSSFQLDSREWQDPLAQPSHLVVDASQANQIDGENYAFGLLWRSPTVRVGMVYETPFRAEHGFTWQQASTPALELPPLQADRLALHWPETYGVGIAWRPTENLLVTGDVRRTPWSKMRYHCLTPLNGADFFTLSSEGSVADATNLHTGAEYLLFPAKGAVLPLRFGLSREIQPIKDPLTRRFRMLYGVSAGAGLKIGKVGVDVAYRYAWSRRSNSTTTLAVLPDWFEPTKGQERVDLHRLDVSINVQFDRRPLERFLRRLFVGN